MLVVKGAKYLPQIHEDSKEKRFIGMLECWSYGLKMTDLPIHKLTLMINN